MKPGPAEKTCCNLLKFGDKWYDLVVETKLTLARKAEKLARHDEDIILLFEYLKQLL